jgi:uncharacterized membrane protein YraQ (UPF0718 family)
MIEKLTDFIVYNLLALTPQTKLAESINFFIYDSIKIFLLLFVMISAIGFLRSYVSEEKIKKWLSGKKLGLGNLLASLFGAITPFCSCSSIPFFIGFIEAGIPLGVTFSFLITSPLVNEYVAVIMLGVFGWKITLMYILAGIIIGFVSGLILGELRLEKYLMKGFCKTCSGNKCKCELENKEKKLKLKDRLKFGLSEAGKIIRMIWFYILLGVAVGAIVHGFVPDELIQAIMTSTGIFAVPLAVLIGVPLYANCAAIVPVAVVLFEKGVPLGTALSFMMATAALSIPEAIILKRVMKLKLIAIFFAIVAVSIIIIGYLFNLLI